jgi:hypothetical protein
MTPPEVILDRWVRLQSRRHRDCLGYVGKLDIEKLDSPSFRPFLRFVQDAMNAALQLENSNASGGVEHPPFHFDYIEVRRDTKNAHAFQYDGFAFIVVTLPLVELLWDLSQRLSRSEFILQMLGIDREAVRLEGLHALLFQFQLSFLVSHEYTHHIHRHCKAEGIAGAWTEFLTNDSGGGIECQAQELDADAYAIYLGLANFIRGTGRQSALAQLGQQDLATVEADELLLTCFFLAVTSLFCALWPEDITITSIWQFVHPPAPVRIEYAIRVAQMWCDQNGSVPGSWFGAERFRRLFSAAVQAIGGSPRQQWDAHISFLRSEEGAEYDRRLLEQFDAIRRRQGKASEPAAVG